MNLNQIFETVAIIGGEILIDCGRVKLKATAPENLNLIQAIAFHDQELLAILQGKTVNDVGSCGGCGEALIGLKTFDGYINRTCGNCGRWFRCLKQPDAICETRNPVVYHQELMADGFYQSQN